MGLLTGIGFHLAGRWLFARTTSASIRLLIGLLFMGPAGAAGLGAGTALADLLGIDGGWRTCLAILVGVAAACASWRALAADRSSMGRIRDELNVRLRNIRTRRRFFDADGPDILRFKGDGRPRYRK